MNKFVDTIDGLKEAGKTIAGTIVGTPVALKATGGFIKGIGSTISNPAVGAVVTKVGQSVHTAGNVLGKYVLAGLKGVAKATAPAMKLAVLGPLAKVAIPLAATGLIVASIIRSSRKQGGK